MTGHDIGDALPFINPAVPNARGSMTTCSADASP